MENSPPPYLPENPESLAAALSQHPDYRVLRRLDVSGQRPPLATTQPGRAAVIDTETTGTDFARDKVIELAVVVFEYDRDTGEVGPVVGRYSAFEDPGFPIPPESTAIHHITDDMVRGQRFNELALQDCLRNVQLVIAHNAAFDRRFLEPRFPLFETMAFGCSQYDIPWNDVGVNSHKLEYLAYRAGFFYEGHRAEIDCLALLQVLAQPLGETGGTAFKTLLSNARQESLRIWANESPFETKDMLRARGYRWDPQERCWHKDLRAAGLPAELNWLKNAVYGGREKTVNLDVQDARGRYSIRNGRRQREKL
jgi:DNA polymerase-3 subunit epsilon